MYDAERLYCQRDQPSRDQRGRDPLRFNADESLDLYLQRGNPGPERESNWLPVPLGLLDVTMRLCAAKREILDGSWSLPPVRKV
jgi:hypothetical protein